MKDEKHNKAQTLTWQLRSPHITANFLLIIYFCASIAKAELFLLCLSCLWRAVFFWALLCKVKLAPTQNDSHHLAGSFCLFLDYPHRCSLHLLQPEFNLYDELIRSPCYSRCDPITSSHTAEVAFPCPFFFSVVGSNGPPEPTFLSSSVVSSKWTPKWWQKMLLNQNPYITLLELSWDNIHLQLAMVVCVCREEVLCTLHIVGKFSLC